MLNGKGLKCLVTGSGCPDSCHGNVKWKGGGVIRKCPQVQMQARVMCRNGAVKFAGCKQCMLGRTLDLFRPK